LKRKTRCLWRSRLWYHERRTRWKNELVFLTAPGISLYIHTNQDYKRYGLVIQITTEYWLLSIDNMILSI
jgi:hypothetical protein